MTYEDVLQKIHDRLRFGNKLTLTRIKELLHLLGDPHQALRVIHVAGTNGKGSVSKYIYSALREGGYSVGIYTSPYIIDFRERIECDGSWITQEELAVFGKRVFEAAEFMESTGSDAPTEFEIVMAIAFLYYKERGCDYVVLEVGLGGSGDATNVVQEPLVSVITSISFDHMEYLGDTLAEIAEEKAGIIKRGCPVVYSVKDFSAAAVIRKKAKDMDSLEFDVPKGVSDLCVSESSLAGSRFSVSIFKQRFADVFVPLAGIYQVENAVTALCALQVLRTEHRIPLDLHQILQGLAKVNHPARFEKICDHPLMIIDGAHNAEGMSAFCNSVRPFIEKKKTLFILGILKDKEFRKMLESALSLSVDLAVSEPENSRKTSAKELAAVVEDLGGSAKVLGDARHAVTYAKENSKHYECILFAGSLYFVSAIRESFVGRGGYYENQV
ncbi:MAG: bifunctional folylpolyglutamate synthase/dihydrofolate synthase [Clostridia bacterium]|nr:bifunctional folylpolyglutamate synthase/dihydrofolate synthase [Clostridia bacterium]